MRKLDQNKKNSITASQAIKEVLELASNLSRYGEVDQEIAHDLQVIADKVGAPDERWYECGTSFCFRAKDPMDAAEQFLDALALTDDWFIEVRDENTGKTYSVNPLHGTTEEDG